jgi:hypothetical protein
MKLMSENKSDDYRMALWLILERSANQGIGEDEDWFVARPDDIELTAFAGWLSELLDPKESFPGPFRPWPE